MSREIQLSDRFGYGRMLRFTLPSIAMMIFTSVYGVVDGFFVSNFVGKTPFAAVNLIMPYLMILGSPGFMIGTGGSALIARLLGEGRHDRANGVFSMLVYAAIAGGAVLAVAGAALMRPVAALMGADGALIEDCVRYGRICMLALPALVLQYAFQSFLIAAQKPQLGLMITVAAGVTNMVLDALLVAVLRLGVAGAAAATAASQVVGGLLPLVYFARKNSSLLHLGRPGADGRALLRTLTNGSSELMTNISMSLVSMLYNVQLIRFAGENGVAAYGVLMYVNFVFQAAFIGYSTGIAPVISYQYGAGRRDDLRGLLQRSLVIIAVLSAVMFVLPEAMAGQLAAVFVGYDAELTALTGRAFMIYSVSFLFAGLSVFGSSFFTALGDGLTSALISFLRTMVFQGLAVLLLSMCFGIDGVWASIVAAEAASALMTAALLAVRRRAFC